MAIKSCRPSGAARSPVTPSRQANRPFKLIHPRHRPPRPVAACSKSSSRGSPATGPATHQTIDWTPDAAGGWIQVTFDLVTGALYVAYFLRLATSTTAVKRLAATF